MLSSNRLIRVDKRLIRTRFWRVKKVVDKNSLFGSLKIVKGEFYVKEIFVDKNSFLVVKNSKRGIVCQMKWLFLNECYLLCYLKSRGLKKF